MFYGLGQVRFKSFSSIISSRIGRRVVLYGLLLVIGGLIYGNVILYVYLASQTEAYGQRYIGRSILGLCGYFKENTCGLIAIG